MIATVELERNELELDVEYDYYPEDGTLDVFQVEPVAFVDLETGERTSVDSNPARTILRRMAESRFEREIQIQADSDYNARAGW